MLSNPVVPSLRSIGRSVVPAQTKLLVLEASEGNCGMPSIFIRAPWAGKGKQELEIDMPHRQLPVKIVQQEVQKFHRIPVEQQRLLFKGKILCSEKDDGSEATIFDYKVDRNDVIQLFPKKETLIAAAVDIKTKNNDVADNLTGGDGKVTSSNTSSSDAEPPAQAVVEEAPTKLIGAVTVGAIGSYVFIGSTNSDNNIQTGNDIQDDILCRWGRTWNVTGEEAPLSTAATEEEEPSLLLNKHIFEKRGVDGQLQCGTVKNYNKDTNTFDLYWPQDDVVQSEMSYDDVVSMLPEKSRPKTGNVKNSESGGRDTTKVTIEHHMGSPVSTIPSKNCYFLLHRNGEDSGKFLRVQNHGAIQVNAKKLIFHVDTSPPLPVGEYAVGLTILCNETECKHCRAKPEIEACKSCGCQICQSKRNLEKLMLCDECDCAYHTDCLEGQTHSGGNGNLQSVPKGSWYCPTCFNDPKKTSKGKLVAYKADENEGQVGSSKKKAKAHELTKKKNWGGGMACAGRSKCCTSVDPHHFGPIPAVPVGSMWEYRVDASGDGVHRPHVAGMAGTASMGCQSIVLSGGYSDDEDMGECFLYTGSGGRDLSGNKRTAKQSLDQTLDRYNAALARNWNTKAWKKGKPVRVIRSSKLTKTSHGDYAPEVPQGWSQSFRYDGIYKVTQFGACIGKSGHRVYRYLLRRDDPVDAPWTLKGSKAPRILRPGSGKDKAGSTENTIEVTGKDTAGGWYIYVCVCLCIVHV